MESQNKNLKSIFFNFLLLLAFIFSVMALYISFSFNEKMTAVMKANKNLNPNVLRIGQEIFIP